MRTINFSLNPRLSPQHQNPTFLRPCSVMSILRKLNTKSLNPQFISSFFFTRFSSSAQYVDPGPFDDPFPDEPTSSYYDHQAFDLLIARLCKIERIEYSLRVVQTMMEKRELNAATFHPILNSLAKKKKMEEAWRVVDIMRVAGVKPDVTAYNYLLTAYCSESKLREASAVVKKIEEEGLGADLRTYDALILGACRVGKVEGGLVLLRSMMDAGKSVMYSTHTHLINGMLSIRYYDGAACGGRDAMLDQESFGVLANKLVSLGREVEAMVVLSEMKKRGLSFGKKLNDFYELHLKNIS
ncbi:pentatricopeptide repeat-containing protein [Gossypium australe]|uniref:Pentatricopeptide repeat-containing protein n=1 Tax=Gossypium australe TaxID=47621 RepID=A0A5B6WB54_9ROSI|nr:pentatricopeptide repeat-containing protein [Gossypium australe]